MVDEFSVKEKRDGETVVVSVVGELDLATAPKLEATLGPLARQGKRVLVELGRVTFIDSTGLGLLVTCAERTRSNGGSLSVRASAPNVLRVFEITGLTQALGVESDEAGTAEAR